MVESKLTKNFMDERGISVIFGTVLVIGVFISAFMLIYPTFSNAALREDEARHMNSVRNSFLELKKLVEDMSEGDTGEVHLQMRIRGGSSGTLHVSPAENDEYGAIEFQARNKWLPSPRFVFEGGAFIEDSGGKVSMTSNPELITAFDVKENGVVRWVRVNVRHIKIENWESMMASKVPQTLKIACVGENHAKPQSGVPNRENVVLNLENKIDNKNREVWWEYLGELENTLPVYYNVQRDPNGENELKLLIEGFHENMKDILYYEENTTITVQVS